MVQCKLCVYCIINDGDKTIASNPCAKYSILCLYYKIEYRIKNMKTHFIQHIMLHSGEEHKSI